MAVKERIQQIRDQFSKSRLGQNRKLLVFFGFVGLATFLWFLRAMELPYTTFIDHPIIYTKLPEDKVLVNELPKKLELEVDGRGYTILRHNWGISKNPVKIDVSALMGESTNLLSVRTDDIKNKISAQLDNLKILTIRPQNLDFQFSTTIQKKVPVKPTVEINIKKDFMIRDQIIVEPDSILVIGPAALIDTLQYISTSRLKFRKLDHSIRRNIGLESPHKQILFEEKRVVVEIPVEQYTENTLSVPLEGINLPDSLHLKPFPAQVQVTFRVVLSAYELIQPEEFRIVVDYRELNQTTSAKVKPKILLAPDLIENPRINPEWVDYLLEKK